MIEEDSFEQTHPLTYRVGNKLSGLVLKTVDMLVPHAPELEKVTALLVVGVIVGTVSAPVWCSAYVIDMVRYRCVSK
jgi:hypothetical protein